MEALVELAPETEELWQEFHTRLGPFIRRRVANAEDAEDIRQDVFLRIHASRDRLGDVRDLPAFIFRIAGNAITDYYRDRSQRPVPLSPLLGDAADESHSPPTPVEPRSCDCDCRANDELTACLVPLVEILPEPYREAIRLTDLGKMTQKEAAARVGISLSGMKSRVQRGRDKLKDLLVSFCAVEVERHLSP